MRLMSAILAVTLVAGCTTSRNIREGEQRVRGDAEAASELLARARDGESSVPRPTVSVIQDGYFAASAPKPIDRGKTLPRSCPIIFAPTKPMQLLAFAQHVSSECGVPVRVSQDALTALNDGLFGASLLRDGGQAQPPLSASNVLPALPALPGQGGSVPLGVSLAPPAPATIDLRYSGDYSGLLDAVTARLGLAWRYRDGAVTIFFMETRFFESWQLPSQTKMAAQVSSGSSMSYGTTSTGSGSSGGGSSGGGMGNGTSNQSSETTLNFDSYGDLTKAIESMLTPKLGRVQASAGGFVVTDRPEVLDSIGDLIGVKNDFQMKQVLLNFKVMSVNLNDSDSFGINWAVVWKSLSQKFGVNLSNSLASSGEAITGTVNILEGSPFSGTKLIIDALSQQGNVRMLTQLSVPSLNLDPTPVQVATQTRYIESSQTTLTSDVGATSSLQGGTITTGFNMMVLPYILPDNQTILMQYSLNLSSLKGIQRYETNGSAIDLPEIDNRIFSQKVRIKTGETLVLSGFEQNMDNVGRSGVGAPKNWLFGGGANSKKTREILVVLITPILTN